MKTIDCTPTWEGLIPVMIELIKQHAREVHPTEKQTENFLNTCTEFRRMAQAADKWNVHVKQINENMQRKKDSFKNYNAKQTNKKP